jgi:glyoxylase-like metal-dependent hydrolase (beta-lactamase superfamily II)
MAARGASTRRNPSTEVLYDLASRVPPAAPGHRRAGAVPLLAPAQPPPLFETKKITDNVYLFRYGGHQSMFVVTPDGVIATDPIAQRRPEAATTYIAEIRKITQVPIKYVVYSHHHYDHIEGGKPFKDAGATFIAHMNAKTRLEAPEEPRRGHPRHRHRKPPRYRARWHAARAALRGPEPL